MKRQPIWHELKSWPTFFQAMVAGKKNFEIRLNDRDFKVGDKLKLKEWKPSDFSGNGEYTDRWIFREILYITDAKASGGLQENYVVLGLGDVSNSNIDTPPSEKLLEHSGNIEKAFQEAEGSLRSALDKLYDYAHELEQGRR